LTSQSPSGATVHRLLGRGVGTGGAFVLLHVFEGETTDSMVLRVAPDDPWLGLRSIRVETVESPSWVAWREIEVIAEGGE
jgi:hypothetical protein